MTFKILRDSFNRKKKHSLARGPDGIKMLKSSTTKNMDEVHILG